LRKQTLKKLSAKIFNRRQNLWQQNNIADRGEIYIGGGNFEYGNFKNGNFHTNLISKIGWLVSSKISDGNFEFSIKNGNFDNVVRNYVTYEHITSPQNQVHNNLA